MEQLISYYERWKDLPRWQKWLFIFGFTIILGVMLYYFQILPLQRKLNEQRKKMESLTLTVNRLKIFEKRKSLMMKELKSLRHQIKQIEDRLPTGKEDVSQILRSITRADNGMSIELIEREPSKTHKYYIEYPYKVLLTGNYPSFIKWAERLSKSERIINFGNIRISASPLKGTENSSRDSSIKVKLEIKAFTLLE